MILDHTQMLSSTRAIAAEQHVTLPTAPSARQAAEIQRLQGLSGKEFELAYIQTVMSDQERGAKMLPKHEHASNPHLSSYVQKTQVALQDHIHAAQHAAVELGAATPAKANQPEKTAKVSHKHGQAQE